MHGSDTNCLVKLLGPIHDCSFCDAFAEMVIMAFRKSPADVCVAAVCSSERKARSKGIKF